MSSTINNNPLLLAFEKSNEELTCFLRKRLKCSFTANDLIQELYLRLLDIDKPSAIQNPRAYLYRIASNLANDHMRLEARRTELLRNNGHLLINSTCKITPERVALARTEFKRLIRVVDSMPPLSRRIFYLNRVEGKPQNKIAKELNLSVTTVEKHFRRVVGCLSSTKTYSSNPKGTK